MSEIAPANFRVDRLAAVPGQIRSIGAIAEKAGKLQQFVDILKAALQRLETDPSAWGDPVFNTIVSGGTVCHRAVTPVVFHFVVYESHRLVVLLEVRLIGDF